MEKRVICATLLLFSFIGTSAFLFGNEDDVGNGGVSQSDVPLIKQRFSGKVNVDINDRVNGSLVASYVYLSMAYWFDRADVALHGFHNFFLSASHKARDDAERLMGYINKRGGYIKLRKIKNPPGVWGSGLKAMEAALGMEKELQRDMLRTHSDSDSDPHLTNFLEDKFLDPRVDRIKMLGDHVTRLRSFRNDYSLGEYIIDRDMKD